MNKHYFVIDMYGDDQVITRKEGETVYQMQKRY